MFRVTRSYPFAASHRLHAPALSDDDNRAIYGKCNHPYGHGHNYVVEVSAHGPLDEHGRALDIAALDGLVSRVILTPFDHHNLNTEVECFGQVVPTSENLAVEACRRLKRAWNEVFPGEWPKLEKVRIAETRKNIFEVGVDEIE